MAICISYRGYEFSLSRPGDPLAVNSFAIITQVSRMHLHKLMLNANAPVTHC